MMSITRTAINPMGYGTQYSPILGYRKTIPVTPQDLERKEHSISQPLSFNTIQIDTPSTKHEEMLERLYDRTALHGGAKFYNEVETQVKPVAASKARGGKKISSEARRARMMYARMFRGKKGKKPTEVNGGSMSNDASLNGGSSPANLKALKGGRSYTKAALKGGRSYTKAALKGGRSYTKAALKGGKSYNKDALKGGKSYNKDALKGGDLVSALPQIVGTVGSIVSTLNNMSSSSSSSPSPSTPPPTSDGISELATFFSALKGKKMNKQNILALFSALSPALQSLIPKSPNLLMVTLGVKLAKKVLSYINENLKQYDENLMQNAREFAEGVEAIK